MERWMDATGVTVDLDDVVASSALQELTLQAGFDVRIDRRLVKILASRPIKTIRFEGAPLRVVLEALLPEFSEPLVWRRWGLGVVLTRIDLEEERRLVYYDIGEFLAAGTTSAARPYGSGAELLEAIREALGPELLGTVKLNEMELRKSMLLARVTQGVHDRLGSIFAGLRARLPKPPEAPPVAPVPR